MNGIDAIEVRDLIVALRRLGTETETAEVKSGAGGFPTSVRETLVSFANSRGGTILIGVDELDEFALVQIDDLTAYRERAVGIARDAITPPLAISAEIVDVDEGRVLALYVPPLPVDQRPAYVTSKGLATGAYTRAGDGDRPLGQSEIALIVANRAQPTYDREPVPDASAQDLDRSAVLRTLQRVRASSQRLRDLPEVEVLHRIGVLTAPEEGAPVTLAALLTFGDYPQRWFPQLMISVAVHPAGTGDPVRFLDNETTRGPIPDMIVQAEGAIRRNLAVRAEINEIGRRDIPEIPTSIIREVLVNAVMHRDYSPTTRGTQVAVDLYPDRLEVRSPGGLYGLSQDDLGRAGASSSRNMVLASLLTETHLPQSDLLVAENRASGIPAMIRSAQEHGLALPTLRSTTTGFVVVVDRTPLLDSEVRNWAREISGGPPAPEREYALAMLRRGSITEEQLKRWGFESIPARRALRDLVQEGHAIEIRDTRPARYVLAPVVREAETERGTPTGANEATRVSLQTRREVRSAARTLKEFTAADVEVLTGLTRPTVVKALNELMAAGLVHAVGAARSPKRRYEWIARVPRQDD